MSFSWLVNHYSLLLLIQSLVFHIHIIRVKFNYIFMTENQCLNISINIKYVANFTNISISLPLFNQLSTINRVIFS